MIESEVLLSSLDKNPLKQNEKQNANFQYYRNKKSISVQSNMGSISSSEKNENKKYRSNKIENNNYQSKNNLLQNQNESSKQNSEIHKTIKKQKSVYQWQAIFVDGKFYLSDRSTVQRYFQIQNLLKEQKKLKENIARTGRQDFDTTIKQQTVNAKKIQNENGLNKIDIPNIEAIQFIKQIPTEQQKLEDQSLLNNLDTSSLIPSRFTLNQINPEEYPSSSEQKQTQSNNQKEKNQDQLKNESQIQNSKMKLKVQGQQSQESKFEYGYFLGVNNEKIYYKKNKDQEIEQLKNLTQSQYLQQQSQKSSFDRSCRQQKIPDNNLGLNEQQKIQLPFYEGVNKLKFNSISSVQLSNKTKQNILYKITEEKQESHRNKQSQKKNSEQKNIRVGKIKRFTSLSSNSLADNKSLENESPKDKLLNLLSTSKPYKTHSYNNTLSKSKYSYSVNKATIFTNNQNVDYIEEPQKDNQQQKYSSISKQFSGKKFLNKLASLTDSNRKMQTHQPAQRNPRSSSFQSLLRKRNPKINLIQKYQLSKLSFNQPYNKITSKYDQKFEIPKKSSQQFPKNVSIQQKCLKFQIEDENKFFQNNLYRSGIQKSRNRLNGFITGFQSPKKSSRVVSLSNSTLKNKQVKDLHTKIQVLKNKNNQLEHFGNQNNMFDQNSHQAEESQVQINFQAKREVKRQNLNAYNKNNCQKMKRQQKDNQLNSKQKINKRQDLIKLFEELNLFEQQNELAASVLSLRSKKQELISKIEYLKDQEIQNQIKEVKKLIRDIQIHKLNKMAKTIDLIEDRYTPRAYDFKQSTSEILKKMPDEIKNILKSSDVAEIKIPKQIVLPSQFSLHSSTTSEQLQKIAIKVYKLFGIDFDPNYRPPSLLTTSQKPELSFKQKQKLLIKKFKNCVVFDILGTNLGSISNKTIVWNFNSPNQINIQNKYDYIPKPDTNYPYKFYIGGWSATIQSYKRQQQEENKNNANPSKGKKNGFGLEINQSFIYQGQYLNGKKHGFGKLLLVQSGYRYQGQFIENHKQGYAKQYNPFKNQIYTGEFKQEKRHGKGYLKKIPQQDQLKTDASKIITKCPYLFYGAFSHGEKQAGQQYFQNGDQYKGSYLNDNFHGKGHFKWTNGSQYEGDFYKNKKQGFGKWSSRIDQHGLQSFYIGQFRNNQKEGQGKYIYKNGAYYQGSFANDLKQGLGSLFYQGQNKQNKILRGIWKQGSLVANEKGQIYKMKLEPESNLSQKQQYQ